MLANMKRFCVHYNVGRAKYLVSFHDSNKKHPDGSDFFDVKLFKNKKKLGTFLKELRNGGYVEDTFSI